MTPEDITNNGEDESAANQHPEVAEDLEATLPASEASKAAIMNAIDAQLAERVERDHGDEVRKGRDLQTAGGGVNSSAF